MIQGINIDLSGVLGEYKVDPVEADSVVKDVIKQITRSFYNVWQQTAGQELESSRKYYMQSLQVHDEGGSSMSVVLHNKLPNMIESGCSAFDMKEGFARSTKATRTKDGGWYLTIPFRFATPGSVSFENVMPEEVYREARKLETSKTTDVEVNGGIVSDNNWGDRLSRFDVPDRYAEKQVRPAFTALDNPALQPKSETEYQHKSSVYEGMVKSEKFYEKANQSTYNTFRRVSSNSDPSSWIHQGIDARNLAEKALEKFDIKHETGVAADTVLSRLGF